MNPPSFLSYLELGFCHLIPWKSWQIYQRSLWVSLNLSQAIPLWPFSLPQNITSMLPTYEAKARGHTLSTHLMPSPGVGSVCTEDKWMAWLLILSFAASFSISHNCSLIYAPFLGVVMTNGRLDRLSSGHLSKVSSVNTVNREYGNDISNQIPAILFFQQYTQRPEWILWPELRSGLVGPGKIGPACLQPSSIVSGN